jgi:hypothetical protein
MPLSLPLKTATPNPANIKALEDGFTSVIAQHAQSVLPWTFYEELDLYLGPWGTIGYPIAYGRFYCVAFNSNEKLMANPQTAEWVRRTTIALQEPLRDYVVDRFKKGTLGKITEPELRQYAFACHPTAYTRGGLGMVILVAPELLPVIAGIPSAEFDPRSDNFSATIEQVGVTLALVTPGVMVTSLATFAGPAHTGILRYAAQRGGMNQVLRDQALARNLSQLLSSVQSGEVDDMNTLTLITARLNTTEFPDQGFAAFARQIVDAANARKHYVAKTYRTLIQSRSELRQQLDQKEPGWSNW